MTPSRMIAPSSVRLVAVLDELKYRKRAWLAESSKAVWSSKNSSAAAQPNTTRIRATVVFIVGPMRTNGCQIEGWYERRRVTEDAIRTEVNDSIFEGSSIVSREGEPLT